MQIFHRYAELLERLDDKGHSYEILGCAPDGQPLVCVRTGGDKTPAIFIEVPASGADGTTVSLSCMPHA